MTGEEIGCDVRGAVDTSLDNRNSARTLFLRIKNACVHYNFQSEASHFILLTSIKKNPTEELWQRYLNSIAELTSVIALYDFGEYLHSW